MITINDDPLAHEPSGLISQVFQFAVEDLKILLADEVPALDLRTDSLDQLEIVVPDATLSQPYRCMRGEVK
jgi:hypothetical protein